jgi:hypothetical protein
MGHEHHFKGANDLKLRIKAMSSKQQFSSKDEVYEALFKDGFRHFSDIPKDFADDKIAFEWLRRQQGDADLAGALYAQIPPQLRSDELLEFVAREGVNVLRDTSPEQTKRYPLLMYLCSAHDYRTLRDVDPAFRNDQTLLKNICSRYKSGLAKLVNEVDWFGPAMSDDFFDECCRDDLQFALDVSPTLMRKSIVEYVDLDSRKNLLLLRSCGRVDLIAEKITVDQWPEQYNEPKSLAEAVDAVLDCRSGYPTETLHMGYVMLYPIDEVVPAMKGARLKKLLLEMYPAEALKPFMKHDSVLKGALLDDALGL